MKIQIDATSTSTSAVDLTIADGGAGTIQIRAGDLSWIVTVDGKTGEATFWRRTCAGTPEGGESTYLDVELPSVMSDEAQLPADLSALCVSGVLDYSIVPGHDPRDGTQGFFACLNVRALRCWGATEHDAVRTLMNAIAGACTRGALDHTGRACGGNPRTMALLGDRW